MTDEEAEAIMLLEQRLTDWMREQPATVEWSLMALGISAARLIYGIGSLQGRQAGADAARLLDSSVAKALEVFRRKLADAPAALH